MTRHKSTRLFQTFTDSHTIHGNLRKSKAIITTFTASASIEAHLEGKKYSYLTEIQVEKPIKLERV